MTVWGPSVTVGAVCASVAGRGECSDQWWWRPGPGSLMSGTRRWRGPGLARPLWTAPLLPPDLACKLQLHNYLLTQLRTTQNLEIMFQTLRQLHSTELLQLTPNNQCLLELEHNTCWLDTNLVIVSHFLLSNKRSNQFNYTLITSLTSMHNLNRSVCTKSEQILAQ